MTARIKQAMQERGVTQAELAAATGIAPTQLARMLRNDEHNYTLRTLQRIAAALGTSLDIEFTDTSPPPDDDEDRVWVPLGGISSVSISGGGGTIFASGGYMAPLEVTYEYTSDPDTIRAALGLPPRKEDHDR